MKRPLTLCLLFIACACGAQTTNRLPLNRAFLQTDLNGNGLKGTNFGTLRSTNFIDASTGLPLSTGGGSATNLSPWTSGIQGGGYGLGHAFFSNDVQSSYVIITNPPWQWGTQNGTNWGLTTTGSMASVTLVNNASNGALAIVSLGYITNKSGHGTNLTAHGPITQTHSTTSPNTIQLTDTGTAFSRATNSVLIGSPDTSSPSDTLDRAVVIGGQDASGQGPGVGGFGSIAIGAGALAVTANDISIGYQAGGDLEDGIVLGHGSQGDGLHVIQIGNRANALHYTNTIGIGNDLPQLPDNTTRIGMTNTSKTILEGVITGNGSGISNVTAATATTATNLVRQSFPLAWVLTNQPGFQGPIFFDTNNFYGFTTGGVFSLSMGHVTGNSAGDVVANSFSGNGASLTALPAAQLTGTIADARLSGNVALLNTNNNFTKSNTFKGLVIQTPGNATAVAMLGVLTTGEVVSNAVPSGGGAAFPLATDGNAAGYSITNLNNVTSTNTITGATVVANGGISNYFGGVNNMATNYGPVFSITNAIVLGTRYTNGAQRAFITAGFTLNGAVAGTAVVTLYIEGNVTNKLNIQAGPLASLTVVDTLSGLVGPNEVYYFGDESTGSGATTAFVANTFTRKLW